jgi:uncharacterized membrane protein
VADEISVAPSANPMTRSIDQGPCSLFTRVVRRCTGGDAVSAILGGILITALGVGSVANHFAGPPTAWMSANVVLATIPVVLATGLGAVRRRGLMWFAGVILLLLALPNTPYLLTDVIHAQANLAHARTSGGSIAAMVTSYVALMTIGIVGYTYVLALVVADLRRQGRTRFANPLLAATNAACAVGIWLGRVTRLSSWDAARPKLVATALGRAVQPGALAAIIVTFVFVGAASIVLLRVAHTIACRLRPTWRRFGGPSISARF